VAATLAGFQRAAAGLGGGQRHRLAVVAGADRQHPARPLGGVQGEQGAERPPGLERAGALQVLGLEQHPAAELAVQQPRGQHRGAVDPAGDPAGRPLHLGQAERRGLLGHAPAATIAPAARSASSGVTS